MLYSNLGLSLMIPASVDFTKVSSPKALESVIGELRSYFDVLFEVYTLIHRKLIRFIILLAETQIEITHKHSAAAQKE